MSKVYLAGPIQGMDYLDVVRWRNEISDELLKDDIIALSPFRGKSHLKGKKIKGYDDHVISCERGLTTRDRYDVMKNCDLFLANFLGATQISTGTMIEYGWADASRKPIITVIEKKGNVHDHAILRELTGFRVESLDEGIEVIKSILMA
jgi:nucleoside 2-deoxyribosyltransferase